MLSTTALPASMSQWDSAIHCQKGKWRKDDYILFLLNKNNLVEQHLRKMRYFTNQLRGWSHQHICTFFISIVKVFFCLILAHFSRIHSVLLVCALRKYLVKLETYLRNSVQLWEQWLLLWRCDSVPVYVISTGVFCLLWLESSNPQTALGSKRQIRDDSVHGATETDLCVYLGS